MGKFSFGQFLYQSYFFSSIQGYKTYLALIFFIVVFCISFSFIFSVINDGKVALAAFVVLPVVVVHSILSAFVAPVFYIFVPGKIDRWKF